MDETETNSMCIEAYHAATRLHTVDILAGIMPRLRVNPAKQQSEPKPLSLRTRKRMTREICTVYRLSHRCASEAGVVRTRVYPHR